MTEPVKVRRIDGSLGLILPQALTEALALKEVDDLFITSTPEGLTVTAHDLDFAETMSDAQEFMRSHHDAFRKLAEWAASRLSKISCPLGLSDSLTRVSAR